jgi:putative iron-regulated protein
LLSLTTPTKSHYYDYVGIRNIYLGIFTRVDGSVVAGPLLSALIALVDPAVDAQLKAELDASVPALGAIKAAVEDCMAYDQMLAVGNVEAEALIRGAVAALVTQTASINRAVTVIRASGVAI